MILKELKELNVKNILNIISQEDIYKYYLPKEFKFNVPFSSPLRVDKVPSFVIGGSNKNYRYKDFATGDTGNCFNFVMNLYNINFNNALIQIVSDLNIRSYFIIPNSSLTLSTKKAEYKNPGKSLHIGETILKIKRREFNQYDYDYWNSYGISPQYLKIGRIVAISHYFLNDIMYIAERYSYAYIEKKDDKTTYKIYQPFSKYKKWLSGNDYSTIELWDLLPKKHKYLIITSSRKDALGIIENEKLPSIAFQSEMVIPKKVIIEQLSERFENIFILYDNDIKDDGHNPGQEAAQKIINKYPTIKNLCIPTEYLSKDYSDLIYNNNRVLAKQIFKDILNNN